MLIGYLPRERLLFEADLLDTDRPLPSAPSGDQTNFYRAVQKLKLNVDRLVPVHGQPVAWSEVAKIFVKSTN
jgi:hypothetical protein